MADTPPMTTDQYNFCRAVEAMKLDVLRSGKEPAWLVAHPGLLALVWGQPCGECQTEVRVCGLQVVELSDCPPRAFYVTHRKPSAGTHFLRRRSS